MPDDMPLHPERRLRGPRVQGPETAVVVGESKVMMQENGTISITGKKILIDGKDLVRITGANPWSFTVFTICWMIAEHLYDRYSQSVLMTSLQDVRG